MGPSFSPVGALEKGLSTQLTCIRSYFPAQAAFSTNARTASRPFSCEMALLSVTNFLTRPR